MVRQEIVVNEKDDLAILIFDLRQHLPGLAHEIGPIEEHADRAKVTCEAAAARELHEGDGEISLALEQVSARLSSTGLRDAWLCPVDLLELAPPCVFYRLVPEKLGIPDVDRVSVLQTFLGSERRMKSAHDDRNTSLPELCGDLVGPPSVVDFNRDGGGIRLLVIGNFLAAVVIEDALHIRRSQTGDHTELERLHSAFIDVEAVLHASDIGLDEGDLHHSAG